MKLVTFQVNGPLGAQRQLRTPPALIGWLRGQQKSREAAEQALTFARSAAADARGIDDARISFGRNEVKLLAPLPRPNSLRDFSIFEEHTTRREGGAVPKRPAVPVRPLGDGPTFA